MTTRVFPKNDINGLKQPEFPYKSMKSGRSKKKSTSPANRTMSKVLFKQEDKSILALKDSLRQECLRLASFLKQETHRPGFVR